MLEILVCGSFCHFYNKMATLASYNFNSCKALSYEIMSGSDITSGYKMDKNFGGLHIYCPASQE